VSSRCPDPTRLRRHTHKKRSSPWTPDVLLAAREKLSEGIRGKGHCVWCIHSAGLVQLCGHQKDLTGGQAYCASLIDPLWHWAYGETLTLTGTGPVDKQAGLCLKQETETAGAWAMLGLRCVCLLRCQRRHFLPSLT